MEETLNGSTTEPTSILNDDMESEENPFADGGNFMSGGSVGSDGGILSDPLAPDENYEYDLGGDSGLEMRTPFDQLLEFEEFDNLGDIFVETDPSDNPFAGGFGEDSDDFANDTGEVNFSNSIDTGVGNTDNGNGNNFIGDSEGESGSNNQSDGNGNWFYGNDNQAEGNGNWNFGDGNQTNGNGNWNLNEESGTSYSSFIEGENSFFSGSDSQGVGGEGGIPEQAFDGNNPIFAGGVGSPAPVGDGEIPDTAENPTGNENTVNGNGNWNFGSNNDTSGNGNWNFGDGNTVANGNGNRNTGDNNEVNGNGNRPSGNDNDISGNSNLISGDGNSINGNNLESDEDSLDMVGNADRYFQTDADGNVVLIGDESADDSNYNFEGVVEASINSELNQEEFPVDNDLAGEDITNQVYQDLTEADTDYSSNDSDAGSENPFADFNPLEDGNSLVEGEESNIAFGAGGAAEDAFNSDTDSNYDFSTFETSGESDPNELIRQSPFGVLLDIPGVDGVEDIFGNIGGGAGGENPFGGGAGGENPFGGGAGGENPFGGGAGGENPFGGGAGGENPFGGGAGGENPFGGGAGGENPFGGGAGGENPFGGGAGGENPFGGGAGGENPFGSNSLEYDSTEYLFDSEDMSDEENSNGNMSEEVASENEAEGEDMSGEETGCGGISTEYAFDEAEGEDTSGEYAFDEADSEDASVEDGSFFGGEDMEYNYSWDFEFADSDSLYPDSAIGDSEASETEGDNLLFEGMDFENPLDEESYVDFSIGENPISDTENSDAESSELELPNGTTIVPFDENGESDLSIDTPIVNEDGLMIGELNISFPDYVEDYYSSVFNIDEIQEFNSNGGLEIFDLEDSSNSLGENTPVLREDNVLLLPGGFEIDLSGLIGDSSDSAI